jgi:dihydrofolate synthase / folylpolyglutamate synthase
MRLGMRIRRGVETLTTRDWDYARALAELWRRSSYERGLISDPFGDAARAERGLDRMRAFLAELGDPQLAVPTVHVAGSKGKGSTAAFIATVARRGGHRTGLFSSPHLHRFPERIAIDGGPLPDNDFARVAATASAAASRLERARPEVGQITTFELITAMAFAAFARQGCDLAVIEVGLGGRYDATNVLAPIVSVITRIDLEHTAVLGTTYAAIAAQKAGILRPGTPCVSSPQVPDAEAAIARAATELGSPLLIGGRDWTWSGSWRSFDAAGQWGTWRNLALGLPGAHQVENACTALAALSFVDSAGIRIPEEAARDGLATASWPGRFERVRLDDRTVVLDGAHTPAAARALVATWHDTIGERPGTVILGMGADKDARDFLLALRSIVGRLIVTRANSPRAVDAATIAAAADAMGIPYTIQASVVEALAAARQGEEGPLLVTGSLFVVGEAREALGLAAPDLLWAALNEAAATARTVGARRQEHPR